MELSQIILDKILEGRGKGQAGISTPQASSPDAPYASSAPSSAPGTPPASSPDAPYSMSGKTHDNPQCKSNLDIKGAVSLLGAGMAAKTFRAVRKGKRSK